MGRPRDPAIDRAVIAAVVEMLVDDGVASIPIEAVAERAGVAKSAIYRRWPSVDVLLADAVATFEPRPASPRDSLRQELLDLLTSLRPIGGLLLVLPYLENRGPATAARVSALFEALRRTLHEMLSRALARGELREYPDERLLLRLLLAGSAEPESVLGLVADGLCVRQSCDRRP
ncbi:TetR/AcrR family transcriptional regulator [Microbispora sp. RL4-1S]|uniref:TetR/AcrR family transcriptional regulator n=1 Tax=Microbispora oryzae TaxID=2806554 RepID=A0A941AID9_9ACTN|nr:TetR family transcriptional regulator [Microbispora oryzae]MBP2705056.1 TetR/AcrR family transcriptional regulator [Microbispora oryzae]